ncbi:MAG TPA: MFS transporter [Ktedonobacteraceae bacterium]|nr:MFS transporter [Ktedonobacteraceae bacterium]
MYTLEDDQETSSTLRKRDVMNAATAMSAGGGVEGVTATGAGVTGQNQQQGFPLPLLQPQQITNQLKRITTPGQANAGGRRVALAALTVACICVFFTALDQTVVVTALPQIVTDLQIPFTQLDHAAWIVSAYLLGFIIAMPLMGRVSDIYGRRRIFLLCLSIFGIGSLFCGLSPILAQVSDLSFLGAIGVDTSTPGLIWLIGARFFQAIGGGAIVPVAMAVASDFYGEERRGLALGIIGAVTEAGGVLGPLYGAVVVEHLGWQYIFYLNVPIVIGLFAAAWFLVPRGSRLREGIDWLGAVLLGLALTCLSLGLAQQGTDLGPVTANSAQPQNNPVALALAVVFLSAFILVERRVRWPVVDLSLFKRLAFSATSLVSLCVGAALIIAMADIPIFVDTVMQRSVLDSGLALMRMTVMIPIGALLGGWLCGRITCRFTAVLGLLFTAVGFYLMSRWPINVGWTQITISTVTAGMGFGLVIAPIGTTAINAVRATQAGTGSAVVTALRMLGMTLGLAALTSWALAYFKHLAAQYPSLPISATTAQFAQWSKGYATHLINSAHIVYSAVFFTAMFLCLIGIVPALFLWGRKPAGAEQGKPEVVPILDTPTGPIPAIAPDPAVAGTGVLAATATAATIADDVLLGQAPTPVDALPTRPEPTGQAGQPPVSPDDIGVKKGRDPKKRRRRLVAMISVAAILLLVLAGVFAAFALQSPDATGSPSNSNNSTAGAANTPTATPVPGPRFFQIALDQGALTSVFASELGSQQSALTNLKVVPLPDDGIVLSLDLNINASGIHRVIPVELDGTVGVDAQQNIQLHILHLKRDGLDAGPTAAANMQTAINQLLVSSLMPALRGQLKGVQIISVHTSATIACGQNVEMLVLLIKAPPIQGMAAQPTPVPFCFKGSVDPSKLFPH